MPQRNARCPDRQAGSRHSRCCRGDDHSRDRNILESLSYGTGPLAEPAMTEKRLQIPEHGWVAVRLDEYAIHEVVARKFQPLFGDAPTGVGQEGLGFIAQQRSDISHGGQLPSTINGPIGSQDGSRSKRNQTRILTCKMAAGQTRKRATNRVHPKSAHHGAWAWNARGISSAISASPAPCRCAPIPRARVGSRRGNIGSVIHKASSSRNPFNARLRANAYGQNESTEECRHTATLDYPACLYYA